MRKYTDDEIIELAKQTYAKPGYEPGHSWYDADRLCVLGAAVVSLGCPVTVHNPPLEVSIALERSPQWISGATCGFDRAIGDPPPEYYNYGAEWQHGFAFGQRARKDFLEKT
jgi:hypothetical protein